MSKNKKNFIYYELESAVIFLIGVLYTLLPTIYGIDSLEELNVNDLFLCMTLILSTLNLANYYVVGESPTKEYLYYSVTSSIVGIMNLLIYPYFENDLTLAISILALTISFSMVKLFVVDYYHDRKDAFYYIEGILSIIFLITGMIISVSVFNNPVIETLELGFFMIILGVVESIRTATKCLLKAPRFLGKIKF